VAYCVDFLERDRQYDVACLLLTKLLMNLHVKPEKRGAWWVRLCIDLKHLKLKKESLKVAEHALLEQSWVKTGYKNSLFRIKDELTKFLTNQQTKTRKKGAKAEVLDDQEIGLRDLMKDCVLTQTPGNFLLTQLNSQIGKEVVPDLVDQYKILREEANHEYFKETYIKAKNASTYEQ